MTDHSDSEVSRVVSFYLFHSGFVAWCSVYVRSAAPDPSGVLGRRPQGFIIEVRLLILDYFSFLFVVASCGCCGEDELWMVASRFR